MAKKPKKVRAKKYESKLKIKGDFEKVMKSLIKDNKAYKTAKSTK